MDAMPWMKRSDRHYEIPLALVFSAIGQTGPMIVVVRRVTPVIQHHNHHDDSMHLDALFEVKELNSLGVITCFSQQQT